MNLTSITFPDIDIDKVTLHELYPLCGQWVTNYINASTISSLNDFYGIGNVRIEVPFAATWDCEYNYRCYCIKRLRTLFGLQHKSFIMSVHLDANFGQYLDVYMALYLKQHFNAIWHRVMIPLRDNIFYDGDVSSLQNVNGYIVFENESDKLNFLLKFS